MKICVNATIVDKRSTGLGIYTLSIVRELVKLGAKLSIFTSEPDLFNGVDAEIIKVSESTQPARGIKGHLKRVAWSQSVLPLKIGKKYDVLFVPTPLEATYFCPVPQVVVVHDLLPYLYPNYYPRQQFYFRKILPRILKKCDLVISVSNNTRNDVLKYYKLDPEKVITIHNCFYEFNRMPLDKVNDISNIKNKFGNYFLYVGNLFPHKNLKNLFEAFHNLHREDIKLIIIGNKDKRFFPGLFDKAQELGISNKIIFLDYVPVHELKELYSNALAFVYPSLYEGFGMPPLEAMANGTPVIVSNTSSLPEIVGTAGEYIDPYSTDSIRAAMLKIIDDKARREELIALGYEKIKEFSWEDTAQKLMENFKLIIK